MFAIAAATPITFFSKLDLQHWPVVGVLAKFSGTVFIKRGSLFSMHETLTSLVDVLSLGRKTIFFPEGTTITGVAVKKFHSGLFETDRHYSADSKRSVKIVIFSRICWVNNQFLYIMRTFCISGVIPCD